MSEDELIRIVEEEIPSLGTPFSQDLRERATPRLPGEEGVSLEASDASQGWEDASQAWGDAAISVQERCLHLVRHAIGEETRRVKRLRERDGDAVYTLKLLHLYASALGTVYERSVTSDERDPDRVDDVRETLHDLFWTGQVAANESILLLSRGFPTGALARWRALLELEARAKIIRLGGRPMAVAFQDHERMRKRRQDLPVLDFFGERNKEAVKYHAKLDQALKDKYGPAFFGDYGWAHAFFEGESPDYSEAWSEGKRERGPRFSDVALFLRLHEPNYSEASSAVHASRFSVMEEGPVAELQKGASGRSVGRICELVANEISELACVYVGTDENDYRMQRLMMLLPAMLERAVDDWEIAEDPDYRAELWGSRLMEGP